MNHRPLPRSHPRTLVRLGVSLAVLSVAAAACGGDDDAADTTVAPATTAGSAATTTAPETTAVAETTAAPGTTTGETTPAPETAPATTMPPGDGQTLAETDPERCAENQSVGTITYLSSFDFAAAASIIDVIVAEDAGYFDALCLDVDLKPSFSTANYPLVASDQAQFSSAGSYTEVLNFSGEGAEFVVLTDYGKTAIEALVTPGDGATELGALQGGTIGVKGDIPPSIVALLAGAGLRRGVDYSEILLDGFDPVAQLATGIDALPVYKSNEPGQLDAAGVAYNLFDPSDAGIPGSFGLIYTSKSFADAHPTVVEDFTRGALMGMADAIADPEAAVDMAVSRIDAAGNSFYLTRDGELFRWQQEMAEVMTGTPEGEGIGIVDPELFRSAYDAYVAAGVWPDGAPPFLESYDADLAAGLYDGTTVVFPG